MPSAAVLSFPREMESHNQLLANQKIGSHLPVLALHEQCSTLTFSKLLPIRIAGAQRPLEGQDTSFHHHTQLCLQPHCSSRYVYSPAVLTTLLEMHSNSFQDYNHS